MEYTIKLTSQELEIMSKIMQEGPYKFVQPILANIGQQVDIQNKARENGLENSEICI